MLLVGFVSLDIATCISEWDLNILIRKMYIILQVALINSLILNWVDTTAHHTRESSKRIED